MIRIPWRRRYRAAARSPRSPSSRFQSPRTTDVIGCSPPLPGSGPSIHAQVFLDLPGFRAPPARCPVTLEEWLGIARVGVDSVDLGRVGFDTLRFADVVRIRLLSLVIVVTKPGVQSLTACQPGHD